MKLTLPIETNTGRERLRLLREIGEGPTARLEGETIVEPGAGPPMHVHWWQDEGFRVVEGRLGYQLADGEPRYLEAGAVAVFPAGVAHRFWNAGDTVLRTEAWVNPAGNFVWFITRLHASIAENGGEKPGFFDAAFLLHHFASEYDMLAIPAPVKRVVFPVVVALGHLLGKYRKYADAPEPMRGGADGTHTRVSHALA
jgi:quercetin dioxygenase-like cupin family protein